MHLMQQQQKHIVILLSNFVKKISTGMRQWQLHWPITYDFPYKKDNKEKVIPTSY